MAYESPKQEPRELDQGVEEDTSNRGGRDTSNGEGRDTAGHDEGSQVGDVENQRSKLKPRLAARSTSAGSGLTVGV